MRPRWIGILLDLYNESVQGLDRPMSASEFSLGLYSTRSTWDLPGDGPLHFGHEPLEMHKRVAPLPIVQSPEP